MFYKDDIVRKREYIKDMFKNYVERGLLLDTINLNSTEPFTILCENIELTVRKDKIVPLYINLEAFKDTKEFIVPDWFECFSDDISYYNYFRSNFYFVYKKERSLYSDLCHFNKLTFVSNDILLKPFELEHLEELKNVDIAVFNKVPAGLFANCKALEDVDARNLEVIERGTFQNCKSLKKVVIGSKLKRVEQKAFINVKADLEVEVTDSLNKNLRIRKDGNTAFKAAIEIYKKSVR